MPETINRFQVRLGGEAGQGVESGGAGFSHAVVRAGLHCFGLPDYMSRIRGGHNFYQVRVSDEPLYTFDDTLHLLLAFNKETVELHWRDLVEGGGVLHDAAIAVPKAELEARGVRDFAMPLTKIAEEQGGHKIMMNTAAIGAMAGLTSFDFEWIANVVESNFKRKGADTVTSNLKVAEYAYNAARDQYGNDFPWKLKAVPGAPKRMLMNGNQAVAMGALAAGCKFISTYPMTPASTITEWLAAHAARFGIVQKQTEDEISAILFAIGAAHAGVRAMTASSGGGFCLMVEALGLAAMSETPLVIAEVQRAGPSTGLPTRTEQSDLEFVLYASHGEFPRIVVAPGTVEQCFEAGHRAFNLAEKYQTPVIILSDLFLSNALRTLDMDAIDFKEIRIDRGDLLDYQALDRLDEEYARHRLTESGVSPRAIPGHEKAVYITTGDEHDIIGHNTEESDDRNEQMSKRMRKAERAAQEMQLPIWYGPADAEMTLVGWGSTYGALREATDLLNARGLVTNFLQFVDMCPLDEDRISAELGKIRRMIVVEQNYTSQLAHLLRGLTGRKADKRINKYDGRPISPDEVVATIVGDLAGEAHVDLGKVSLNGTGLDAAGKAGVSGEVARV
ncbi:MAG: 2-oxoacid:acceptor oxidoreductase subunit alpha [Chloroflexi bacterium]|nr:2-oxoacid:acceptor oxidoreductase subunit alpha [Chloroflexota bacterium]